MNNESMRFFEWDYENQIVVEYERLGDCNGCGDCCHAVIQFMVAGKFHEGQSDWEMRGNGGSSTNGQGVWNEIRIGEQRRFFQVNEVRTQGGTRCSSLTDDMRCGIHQTKPLLHKAWPMAPQQVTPFERCSYTFREIARWPIES